MPTDTPPHPADPQNEHDSPPPLQGDPVHVVYGFTAAWIILISTLLTTFALFNANFNGEWISISCGLAFMIWVCLMFCPRKSPKPFIRGLKLGTLTFSALVILGFSICTIVVFVA